MEGRPLAKVRKILSLVQQVAVAQLRDFLQLTGEVISLMPTQARDWTKCFRDPQEAILKEDFNGHTGDDKHQHSQISAVITTEEESMLQQYQVGEQRRKVLQTQKYVQEKRKQYECLDGNSPSAWRIQELLYEGDLTWIT